MMLLFPLVPLAKSQANKSPAFDYPLVCCQALSDKLWVPDLRNVSLAAEGLVL